MTLRMATIPGESNDQYRRNFLRPITSPFSCCGYSTPAISPTVHVPSGAPCDNSSVEQTLGCTLRRSHRDQYRDTPPVLPPIRTPAAAIHDESRLRQHCGPL